MWRDKRIAPVRAAAALLLAILLLTGISPRALAAPPEELVSREEQQLRFERWYEEMEDLVELFRRWSAVNGVYDGKGYVTTNGKPFKLSVGNECYIGGVTANMKKAGLIDYTVAGGWSCNGFARFALATLYNNSSFWRPEMTENVYTMSLFSRVSDVRAFFRSADARVGDMVAILGYTDFDGDGVKDEYFHYMIYIRETGEGLLVLDGNFDHDNAAQIHMVPWEFLMSREWVYLYHVSDQDYYSIDKTEDEPKEPEAAAAASAWQFLPK